MKVGYALPPFTLGVIENPKGFVPGTYYFAVYLPTFTKVSRYLRKPGSVMRKIRRYEAMYAAGDRYWPEVDRCDELRDSDTARLTFGESLGMEFGLMPCPDWAL